MDARFLDLAVLDRFRGQVPADVYLPGRKRKYPARLNRYLIASSYLFAEAQLRASPLRVCEIGISRGLLPSFFREAAGHYGLAPRSVIETWDGIDLDVSQVVRPDAYDSLIERNVEREAVAESYDVYFLLHVLEHLFDPLATLKGLMERAAEQALFVVGVPSHPHWLHRLRETTIRQSPNDNGHVSAFSRSRLRRDLAQVGLTIEDERAAYVLRASGSICEDSAWWQNVNLALGRRFPGFPGEYFVSARAA